MRQQAFEALKIVLPIAAIFIALVLACALRIGRQVSASSPVDPYFYPFGEMPIVPRERHLIAGDFRAWGIPGTKLKPSAGALRRKENVGRNPASSLSSGPADVLTFRKVRP